MKSKENNYAFIDAANLHKSIAGLGWKLDYRRFRVWLQEKYGVSRAYVFIGLVPKHKDIYTFLQEIGFTLVFKETASDGNGNIKGNCDADLVLSVTRDTYENSFDKAIIVSSDGDYASLVKFLQEKNKLKAIISPNDKCSILLKRTNASITYLGNLRHKLQLTLKEKAPYKDGTS